MSCCETPDVEKGDVEQSIQNSAPSSPDHPESPLPVASATPAAANNGEMHPMMKIMQEKELGKFLLPSAIAILGIVVAGKDRFDQSEISFVLILVCVGFTASLYGIGLKDTFPKSAQIVEALGIVLVAVSFYAIVAFFMPLELLWVPAFCIVSLFLLPLIILVCPPTPIVEI